MSIQHHAHMHPNRQFLPHFVVHMPLCLYDLFRVARPFPRNVRGEGSVTWGMSPRRCEDTITRKQLLCKGRRGYLGELLDQGSRRKLVAELEASTDQSISPTRKGPAMQKAWVRALYQKRPKKMPGVPTLPQ